MSTLDRPEDRRLTSVAGQIERRKSLRLEVLGRINGVLVVLELPVTLVDISRGGFMMRAARPLAVDSTHQVRFIWNRHPPIVLAGRVVRVLRTSGGAAERWMMGLEFVDASQPAVTRDINALLQVVQPT